MIKQMNNIELNDILFTAVDDIKQLKAKDDAIENSMTDKLTIIKNEDEFANSEVLAIKELLNEAAVNDAWKRIVFAKTDLIGTFEKYGDCVHPKTVGKIGNCFNFITATGAVFKNNMTEKVNGTTDEGFKSFLKHDSITGKGIFFKEYDTADLTISMNVNGTEKLGETIFNIIEFLPFMPGSFDITEARIYTVQDMLTNATASITFNMDKVGQTRYIMPEDKTLAKAEFDIHINFQNGNGKYPFGLKHLYFLHATLEANSYVSAQITATGNIDWIGDTAILRDQDTRKTISLDDKKIEAYLRIEDNEFKAALPISTIAVPSLISYTTSSFYIKMPLTNAVRSLLLKEISLR